MTESVPRRVVAIVGRPNVGKSALFNKLAGRRVAIVHEETGVTRDRVSCEVTRHGERFELIDTGGVAFFGKTPAVDQIQSGTRAQVDVAIQDAAVIVFVTDATAGVLPLDEEVARLLRTCGKKVFLAANKSDNETVEAAAAEFEKLGFPVFPVSALHARGLDPLITAILEQLPEGEELTAKDPLRVVVVGRPNVGKSSYINRLLGSERVIVSDIPGTTRDSIEIPFSIGEGPGARHYLLVDTAGMRKQGRVHESVEKFSLFRAEESIKRADVAVLLLDTEDGPTVQDKKIAAAILEAHKGCVLLVNKWDLRQNIKEEEYEKALRRVMFFFNFVPILFVSTKSGFNMKKSIEVIDEVARQNATELTTGLLNRVVRDAVDRVQPPQVKGKRMKFYYATQTGTRPVRIRIFVSDRTRVTDPYKVYLGNALRSAFGLEGAPIVLDFRSSHGPEGESRGGR